MTDAVIVDPVGDGDSKRRLQILLGVLLVAVLVYAGPKVLFRDAGSAKLQIVPAPVTESVVEEPPPVTVARPSASIPTDDDTGAIEDLPVRVRDGKNPFEPRMPMASRPTNPGTDGIVPPAPTLPPTVVPPAPEPEAVLPAPTPVFGAPPAPSQPVG